ncbi:hypothetical protein DOM22_18095 [Bdellovibrio sp. ZAP7]|uniref:hypothetical protein n=1 Tax=Bdellovibrio sp. ZAP7 TaxID=2231053 RepID=UPI00115C07A6|nr:hypothetical protein [Bdellovibrio sp. ZAP7]QDK46932.1 hypothetical protein DOM22_18095 [Bdellovibrio sp. ZAP7]
MKKLLLFSTILFAQTSWSTATEFGNGGNAVVCPYGEHEIVTAYDMNEVIFRYELLPSFPPMVSADCQNQRNGREICETGTDIARAILNRLALLDQDLMNDLLGKLDTFWSEAILVYGDLTPVNDSGLSFVPEGCSLKQLAIQQQPIFEQDSRYFISGSLWNKMDGQGKAVLILHEIIYRYALEHGAATKSSVPIRYFNSLLISDKLKEFTPKHYMKVYFQVFRINQEPER